MNTLKSYLKTNKISYRKFADKIKAHYMMVYFLCNGKRKFSPNMAMKIEKATKGEIHHDSLLYTVNMNCITKKHKNQQKKSYLGL